MTDAGTRWCATCGSDELGPVGVDVAGCGFRVQLMCLDCGTSTAVWVPRARERGFREHGGTAPCRVRPGGSRPAQGRRRRSG